ncbi:MAG: beta-lactamase family protein [Maribacter sp.]|nr:beta-lactamase family protein [Maribacter sp.]
MKHLTKVIHQLGFIFLLVTASQLPAQSANPIRIESVVEESIDKIFKDFDGVEKPGAAVAVIKNGEIIFKKGYGSANMEYDIPVTPSTIFHVASVSKQFTVYSILLLAEEGKLSLDDDIRKYIPEVPDFGKPITLRHLATHTSGMRDQWDLLSMAGWRNDDVITKEHILKLVAKQKALNFDPGEEYNYCNTGFTLLAEVVARISGKTFYQFTKENIFEPLQMNNSQFYDDHERIVRNRAYSYEPTKTGYKKSVLSFANVGATSLFTTVEDLSLWGHHLNRPSVQIKPIVEQMNTLAVLNNGKTFNGAYGQFVTPYKGIKQIQHGGADAGYRSYLGRFPDQDIAISVFSNFSKSNPAALSLQVADLFLTSEVEAPKVSKKVKEPKTINLSSKALTAFENYFWNEESALSRRIYVKKDTLRYNRGGTNETPLAAIAKKKFMMLNVPGLVTVEFKTEEGKDRMIVVQENQPDFIAEAYEYVEPSKVDLKQYEGSFFSEELDTRYLFTVFNGVLMAKHRRNSDIPNKMIKADYFNNPAGVQLQFVRDNTNGIIGINVTTGRVRDLWFQKE